MKAPSQNELLEALAQALQRQPVSGGAVGVTTNELSEAMGNGGPPRSLEAVRRDLKHGILAGRIERVRVLRQSLLDGRISPIWGFRPKP